MTIGLPELFFIAIWLLLIALHIFCIIKAFKSSAKTEIKILWILFLIFLPGISALLFLLLGPKK